MLIPLFHLSTFVLQSNFFLLSFSLSLCCFSSPALFLTCTLSVFPFLLSTCTFFPPFFSYTIHYKMSQRSPVFRWAGDFFFSSFPTFCCCRPIIKRFRLPFDVSWRSLFSTDRKFIFLLPPFPFRKVKETLGTHFSKSSVLVAEQWRQAARNRHCFLGFYFCRLPIIPLTLWSERNLYSCLNTAWGRPEQCAVYTEPRDTWPPRTSASTTCLYFL